MFLRHQAAAAAALKRRGTLFREITLGENWLDSE